jgi:hypothetical protein
VLDSAGHGPVTITKSVSIIAPPGIYGGISVFSGNGVTIDAPGATVVLRGLSINGQGGSNGILAQQAARVRVENCVVFGMAAVGIYHTASNAEMIVTDTMARDNNDGLAIVAPDAKMLVDRVRSERNQQSGLYIGGPIGTEVSVTAVDSVFADNRNVGVWAGGPSSTYVFLHHNRFSGNRLYGLAVADGAVANATGNTFGGNFINPLSSISLGPAIAVLSQNSGGAVSCSTFSAICTYGNNNMDLSGCTKISRTPQ